MTPRPRQSQSDTLERLGRAFADPTRQQILLTLLDGPAYPAALAEALGTTRSNLSNHLACLRGCGLVRTEREGRHVRYGLVSDRLAHALSDLVSLELPDECAADATPLVAAGGRARR